MTWLGCDLAAPLLPHRRKPGLSPNLRDAALRSNVRIRVVLLYQIYAMRFPQLRRLKLFGQMLNHGFWHGIWSIPVLTAQLIWARFEIDNLHACTVVTQ